MNNATPPDAVYEGYPGILTRRKREVMSCERPSFYSAAAGPSAYTSTALTPSSADDAVTRRLPRPPSQSYGHLRCCTARAEDQIRGGNNAHGPLIAHDARIVRPGEGLAERSPVDKSCCCGAG
jgi:hypothetical protein